MRRPAIFTAILLAAASLTSAAAKKPQAAIMRERTRMTSSRQIVLDFVEVRDCNCAGGVEVVEIRQIYFP